MSAPEKIDGLINSFLSDRGYSSVCKEYDIIQKWGDIVGNKVASNSECLKVDNGILYVSVISSSWRQEMTFLKTEILRKIKTNFNCQSIEDIIFF
jgi:hypothetical protein